MQPGAQSSRLNMPAKTLCVEAIITNLDFLPFRDSKLGKYFFLAIHRAEPKPAVKLAQVVMWLTTANTEHESPKF